MAKWMSAALVAAVAAPAAAQDGETLTGAAAFGDYSTDRPGVARLIRPDDLPAPFASSSASAGSRRTARPEGALPQVPEGFRVALFAEGLNGPRTLRVAPNGDIFLAESGADRIRIMRMAEDGSLAKSEIFADGLNAPYGIAFFPPDDPAFVYVGENDRVIRFPYTSGNMAPDGPPEVVVPELPAGGHWTRDIAFSPEGSRLFIAVGSASNVAEGLEGMPPAEIRALENERGVGALWGYEANRAAVLVTGPEGGDLDLYATGVRNCAGLGVHWMTGDVWCVTNERDGLGDDLPPDYATSLREGGFYGWPWFYAGANEDPRLAGQRPDLAGKVLVPDVLIQPHSAPLGIAFYDGDMFPVDYTGDAFVTLHGSWNRSKRTGYKVVRLPIENGRATGAYEDFMVGFVASDQAVWGRPVGVAVAADGSLLVSEDGNGTIWRVWR